MTAARFAKFTYVVLGFALFVIVWGSFVRASGSGAGCGSHWPDCNGEVIPIGKKTATLIEFTHRTTSGALLIFAIGMAVTAFRIFPKRHLSRWFSLGAVVCTIISAIIGAWLVKYKLVEQNDSVARAVVLSAHFVNTMLLLACVALAGYFARRTSVPSLRCGGLLGWALIVGAAGLFFIGMSGAVTALGDTLFPVRNSLEVLQAGLSPTGNFLLRLRIWHPVIACGVALYLLFLSALASDLRPAAKKRFRALNAMVVIQILLGFVNVRLHAPVAMSLLHLLVAELLWLAFIFAAVEAVAAKHTADAREGSLAPASQTS